VGNLERGLATSSWNVAKQMQNVVNTQGIVMPIEELALDVGIMADAALDASTETMMWFVVACITEDHRGWLSKAQKFQLLDSVTDAVYVPAVMLRATACG
jgi:hypothetical protein